MFRTMTTRNYLRVRGEYAAENIKGRFNEELPPRARRIPVAFPLVTRLMGTTSACAENTEGGITGRDLVRNYLRVRGEYRRKSWPPIFARELPPRARRIPMLKAS